MGRGASSAGTASRESSEHSTYEDCVSNHSLSDTDAHRQHLLESHGRDHHCSKCWKAYKRPADATNCQRMNEKCSARTAPPKLWLPDEISRQMRAARLPGKGREAWYKLFGLLFPDMEEDGPAGYRARYTPCKPSIWETGRSQPDTDMPASSDYSNTQNLSPARLPSDNGTASPSRPSPYSIWTPSSSNSTNYPAGSTPLGGDGIGTPYSYPAGPEPELPPLPPDPPSQEAFDTVYQQDNDPAALFAALTQDTQDLNLPQSHVPDNMPAGGAVLVERSTAEPLLGFPTGEAVLGNGQTLATPPHEGILSVTPSGVFEPSCSCLTFPKCMCRLRTRNAEIGAENEMLRAALGGIRQALKRHDGLLQKIEDGNMLRDGGVVMKQLWSCQDDMSSLVSSHP